MAKLTDLGLVKEVDADLNLTRTGRGLGTPHFMAPEQFRNAKNADVRCDIYSLGATLYMMVTGELPFGKTLRPARCWMKKIHNDITPPRQLVPELSERCDWAIRRSMSADPNLRPEQLPRVHRGPDRPQHAQGRHADRQFGDAPRRTCGIWFTRTKPAPTHTVKGSTEGIRRSLKERLLGDASNIRACRSKTGPFEPLKGYPEFRDLVVTPANPTASGTLPATNHRQPAAAAVSGPMPHIKLDPTPSVPGWLIALGMFVVAAATALCTLYFFFYAKK